MIFDTTPTARTGYKFVEVSLEEFPGVTGREVQLALQHMRGLAQSKPVLPEWPKPIIGGDGEMNERFNALTRRLEALERRFDTRVGVVNGTFGGIETRVDWLRKNLDDLRQTLAEAGEVRCLKCGEGECEC